MSDFLTVSGAGVGSWAWDDVWGYLTAPVQAPPTLHQRPFIDKVVSLNLSGLPGREVDSGTRRDDLVSSIVDIARSRDLKDLVMVGHGLAAPFVLQAASKMDPLPKRVVIVGGVIPEEGRRMTSELPLLLRLSFCLMQAVNLYRTKEIKLPKHVVRNRLCNGMESSEFIKIIGLFNTLPAKLLSSRAFYRDICTLFPLTYLVLTGDKIINTHHQRKMARRLGDVGLIHLDACHAVMLHRPKQLAEILMRLA